MDQNVLELKYRTWWYKGIAPKPIKLQIPGWTGDSHAHNDGAKPQPWHCIPFVEGSTYGLELIYPYDSECRVVNTGDKVEFQGDFSDERPNVKMKWPPFATFAPGHYGFTSSLDLKPPEGYVIRLEPHPSYFTDPSYSVPCVVPGHLQGWWSRIFFVAFKAPPVGQVHIFRKNEPYGQILLVPKKVEYKIAPMTFEEEEKRCEIEILIQSLDNHLTENCWIDHVGHSFNDKYKVLSRIYKKEGEEGLMQFLKKIQRDVMRKNQFKPSKKIKKILVKSPKSHPDSTENQVKTEKPCPHQ